MSLISRLTQNIAAKLRTAYQWAMREAERFEAAQLYRIYETERSKCEAYSNEESALLAEARFWLDHPQGMLPDHVARFSLRMQEHGRRAPFERSTLVDSGNKLKMPRLQRLHWELFKRIFWAGALWFNIQSLVSRQADYVEFKTWQVRGGLLMGTASMAKEHSENILKQLNEHKTPFALFSAAMKTLEEEYGPFGERSSR